MIQAYPEQPTVLPGRELLLRVSTDAPQFRVTFYRWGSGLTECGASAWLDGEHSPQHLPHQDWGRRNRGLRGESLEPWRGYSFPVPYDWEQGPYIAMLAEGDGRGREIAGPDPATPDARYAKALFVVRNDRPRGHILYKLPLLTYHAYNEVSPNGYDPVTGRGGWCLYSVPPNHQLPAPVPAAVSLRRPGGGTGGTPWDIGNFDPYDASPRQTFVHWDAPFIAWLESNGYRVDYCTDLDLHADGEQLLRGYRLMVSGGHDEYWSDAMRGNAERFVSDGGNIAFFSGNTCWWRVAFDDDCSFRRLHPWSERPVPNNPENSLTGVSFRNGGERDRDDHPIPVGYRVQHADHWVYAGTGLRDGEVIGDRPDEYLVGYECDGAHFDRALVEGPRPATPTGIDGTPRNFVILGIGDVAVSGWGLGNRAATMGLYTDNGTVFTASTTDWPRVLAAGRSPAVERITRNVLDRLG